MDLHEIAVMLRVVVCEVCRELGIVENDILGRRALIHAVGGREEAIERIHQKGVYVHSLASLNSEQLSS